MPCLQSYCGDACGEIVIREFTVHEPKENVLAAILAEQPDVVAFSVYLWNRRETLELVDLIATVDPAIRLVIGGPEVSFDGAELFAAHPGLDAIVRGEGEIPMRGLLAAWNEDREPADVPRLCRRQGDEIIEGPKAPPLENLDDIPSPFLGGMVDVSRGFVYYETSRGCPYSCSFCMSALDDSVRSFSMARIENDLDWLLQNRVPKIKLVDRTFNYDAKRAREIFRFILGNNRESHVHFEIGAHLLDDATFELLAGVPAGMFHFEIGVQSTLPETLNAIDRKVAIDIVMENIRRLRRETKIELHLDLIAGLPGEGYASFLQSIDRVLALQPDHLQVEPVKLLPGSPLRHSAKTQDLRYDPHPPYTIVGSPDLSHGELGQLRSISRTLDLTWNSNRLNGFLQALAEVIGSPARALERLALHLQNTGLLRLPLSQDGLFNGIRDYLENSSFGPARERLREHLARDYALCERVIPARAPDFFNVDLTADEAHAVRAEVEKLRRELQGSETRVQYFAAAFHHLGKEGRRIHLFLYLTRSGRGREIREVVLPAPGVHG